MLPCKDCITLPVCKGIVKSVFDNKKINFMETFDEPDNALSPYSLIKTIQNQIITRLRSKCSLIEEYIRMEMPIKYIIFEQYPSDKGFKDNYYALSQVYNYFNIPTVKEPLPKTQLNNQLNKSKKILKSKVIPNIQTKIFSSQIQEYTSISGQISGQGLVPKIKIVNN